MKFLPLVWYGIWRKKGRTFLILFQIMVAFVLFGLLQGMKSGIDQTINGLGADLYVATRADGFDPLPIAHFEKIRSLPGINSASYESYATGFYQDAKQGVLIVATDIANESRVAHGLKIDAAVVSTMQTTRTGAVMSEELAKKYGWKKGDHITLKARSVGLAGQQNLEFDVVGTFDPGTESLSKDYMMINYAYLDEARTSSKGTIQRISFRISDPKYSQPVVESIDALFRNSPDETRTSSIRENAQSGMQAIGDLEFIVQAIMGAALFALLFSVGAMMMQSLRERTSELTVLKTLGFKDMQVFMLILAEGMMICIFAALLGMGIARMLIPLAGKSISFEMEMPDSVLGAGLAISVLLSLMTTSVPAWRARKLQIADALANR